MHSPKPSAILYSLIGNRHAETVITQSCNAFIGNKDAQNLVLVESAQDVAQKKCASTCPFLTLLNSNFNQYPRTSFRIKQDQHKDVLLWTCQSHPFTPRGFMFHRFAPSGGETKLDLLDSWSCSVRRYPYASRVETLSAKPDVSRIYASLFALWKNMDRSTLVVFPGPCASHR